MKKFKVLLFVAVLAVSNLVSANTDPKIGNNIGGETITSEIGDLLKNPSFEVEGETIALVTFTLNKNNEVVVLYVDTENEVMANYIKGRLNYKSLSVAKAGGLKTFNVPVRFTSQAI